ncbi:MAG: heparinase II/III family protein, partial [Terriglobia bacterium]
AWAAGGLAPEVAWLLGKDGCEAFETLQPAPPQASASRLFQQGGYAVMRSGWEPDAHQLLLDVGPLGCPFSSGHGHTDLLSVQCATFGEARLVDPGTYCYTAEPRWRNHFRGSHAHNTVVVDGEDQAIPTGPFSWLDKPQARVSHWISTPKFDFIDAEHEAYKRLSDPVTHRRRVLFVKPHYWILVDDLYGSDVHRIELLFQFAPSPVILDPNGWTVCSNSSGAGLLLRSFASCDIKAQIKEGDVEPIAGWVSPDYGVREPAPLLVYSTESLLPLRIVTLLLPRSEENTAIPDITFGSEKMQMNFVTGCETLRIDDKQIIVERAQGEKIIPIQSADGVVQ